MIGGDEHPTSVQHSEGGMGHETQAPPMEMEGGVTECGGGKDCTDGHPHTGKKKRKSKKKSKNPSKKKMSKKMPKKTSKKKKSKKNFQKEKI